jgi:mono/diheme cytochrome c family protein
VGARLGYTRAALTQLSPNTQISPEFPEHMQTVKLFFVLAAVLLAACGTGSAPPPTAGERPTPSIKPAPTETTKAGGADEFATVRAEFAQFCINCHKADGTGGPFRRDDGKTLDVPSLREHGLKDSDEELAEQIRDGGGGMPPFKSRLDEKRINDLVRFIRKEFHGR